MNAYQHKISIAGLGIIFSGLFFSACKKFLEVPEPINYLTTTEVLSTDATAVSAMSAIYSTMINGSGPYPNQNASSGFSAGLATYLSALSADEFYTSGLNPYNSNHILAQKADPSNGLWTSAYDIIYKSNAIIEGIAASNSSLLHDTVRKELTAEAKFTRGFSYFYLTNFFGDVPLALTIDFNKTQNLPRAPQSQVYRQIINDLKDAQANLPVDFSVGHGERIIPNKWAATLLLARVYLYTGDYTNAAAQATAIINNTASFGLEPDLNNVFSTTSREAVWQLKQTLTDASLKNGTPEGEFFLPVPLSTGQSIVQLTNQFLSSFENGDKRRSVWVDSTDNSYNPNNLVIPPPVKTYYPYKYTISAGNGDLSQPPPQYYMVLRLAEAFLIRAEAEANGAAGGAAAAVNDLNRIRNRAGLPNLNTTGDIKAAVAKERQAELFAEWGHRWFDLKRTGQAHNVLSAIPSKQPWAGDYQLLYPIPLTEIKADHFLTQNPGY